jgi:hypothetical protein
MDILLSDYKHDDLRTPADDTEIMTGCPDSF